MESFFSITLLTVCPLPEQIKNEIRLIAMNFLWIEKTHLISNYYRQKYQQMSKYT
jgi:hypothetical protein